MIRMILQDCHVRLRKYRQRMDEETAKCFEFMGENDTQLLQQMVAERAPDHKAKREAALEIKFLKLPRPNSSKDDKLVHNLSSKKLTEEQMEVLRHETSFNTADARPAKMVAAIEPILSQRESTDETKNLISHQVSSLLMAHRPRDALSKIERKALRELRVENDLVIVPADKGLSTVVLDRIDYIHKAETLLNDRQSYAPCKSNRMARVHETALARFCGLLKVHKEGALHPPPGQLYHSKALQPRDW
ncbi:unnamed protein product [Dibothriocephalus latus]|uniref:Uncharacterized protein n=1 Tax=Dibothriocephalus latus TaxID=60516 RepID=A0A3P6TPJ9_DIBLA|nr:unnamed protein product [Dibothriocephalus latus]